MAQNHGPRRQARELSLQVLFQREFVSDLSIEEHLETFKSHVQAPLEAWNYAEFLLQGVTSHQTEIDALIEAHSAHWKIPRMALVDLTLMRMAVFEIHFSNGAVPPKSALNEAIEISKKYGSTESASFVNGVLDQILKQAQHEL